MKRPTILSLFLGLTAVGLLALYAHEALTTRRLKAELARRSSAAAPETSLQRENARLRAEVEAVELEHLRRVQQLADLEAELKTLRARSELQLRQAAKARAERPKASGAIPVAAPLPSVWVHRGNATAMDAFHSALAAAVDGEVDALARLVALDSKGDDVLRALYERLPPSTRAQYPSREHVMATLLASRIPLNLTGADLQEQRTDPAGHTVMKLSLKRAYGSARTAEFRFVQRPDGWRIVVPDHIVQSYTAALGSSPESG